MKAFQENKPKMKRKKLKDDDCYFHLIKSKQNNSRVVVIYLHNIIKNLTKETNVSDISGVNCLISRQKEMPYDLLIPICPDYVWALKFKSFINQNKSILDYVDDIYIIGSGLSGASTLLLADYICYLGYADKLRKINVADSMLSVGLSLSFIEKSKVNITSYITNNSDKDMFYNDNFRFKNVFNDQTMMEMKIEIVDDEALNYCLTKSNFYI